MKTIKMLFLACFLLSLSSAVVSQSWGLWEVDRSWIGLGAGEATDWYSLWDDGVGTFNDSDLGTFILGDNYQVYNWDIKTWGDNAQGAAMWIRVYETGDPDPPAFEEWWQTNYQVIGGSDRIWRGYVESGSQGGPAFQMNVLEDLEPGNYTLEVYIRVWGSSNPPELFDSNDGNNFSATFGVERHASSFTGTGSWSDSENWSDGLPGPESNVTIDGEVTLDIAALVHNLSITNESSLTISPVGTLTVTGTLINENNGAKNGTGLLIQSDATGTGSLIHNTPGVQAAAERHILSSNWSASPAVDWHMISSPVANQLITGGWIADGVAGDYDFFAWEEGTGTWLNQKHGPNGITHFIPGQGYLVAYEETDIKEFYGELNTGVVSFTLLHEGEPDKGKWEYEPGWNLIGNPYPSAIDWGAVDHNEGTSLFQDVFAYVYDRSLGGGTGGYVNIDGTEADAFIPVNQGFFVIAKSGSNNEDFTFNNDMRAHGGDFYKKQILAGDLLKLRLSNEYYDETTIRILDGSGFERDRTDALKLFSFADFAPQIYSLTSDNIMVAVNSIPKLDAEREIILGTRIPEDGEYTLSVQEMGSIFQAESLLLIDSHEEIIHDLKENPTYEFIAEAGDEQGRFRLRFSPLDDDDPVNVPETDSQDALKLWFHNNTLFVDNASGDTELRLYDSAGRFLQSFRAGMGQQSFELQLSAGVYVVHSTGRTYGEPLKIVIQ